MGVPRLWVWVCKTFPDAVKHFQHGEYSTDSDYVYYDANGLLHEAAQEVENYGDKKSFIDRFRHLDSDLKKRKIFEFFFDYICELVKVVRPNKVLYIAIDGPAPLAKQAQQRERRYVSARTRLETEEKTGKKAFDSNQMTPGTSFMFELTQYFNYAIRKQMNTDRTWRSVKVIFSPPSVPSEGEHKVMDFIRSLPESERSNASHCFFGPDGDLIMLTLSIHIPKMILLREDQYNFGFIHILDSGYIRKKMANIMKQKSRSLDDVTNDFISLGFFVGNDFLPKLQMFHLLEDGLDFMLETYAKTSQGKKNFLTIGGEFNIEGYIPFLDQLVKYEEQFLIDQAITTNPRKVPPEPKFRNETLLKNIKQVLKGNNVQTTLNFDQYRIDYYEKSKIRKADITKINQMCFDYLKTFVWVLKYYINGLPAWRWAYEWHHAPLMCDFSRYVKSLDSLTIEKIMSFELDGPSLPFEQLLSVLPPTSSSLLPPPYQRLMHKPRSPLIEYYPDVNSFDIDYEGKLKEYQGIAILPFVDYNKVHMHYDNVTCECVLPKKYSRNTIGKVSEFNYDSTYTAKYKSEMGIINKLHIRRKIFKELK